MKNTRPKRSKLVRGLKIAGAGAILAFAGLGVNNYFAPYRTMRNPVGYTTMKAGVDFPSYWNLAQSLIAKNPDLEGVNPQDLAAFIEKQNPGVPAERLKGQEIKVPIYAKSEINVSSREN